jgi:hypothetical protein
MSFEFFSKFTSQRTPACITRTATGGVAAFAGSQVTVEFRTHGDVLTGITVRDGESGVAIAADHLGALPEGHELRRIADELRRDAHLV